VTSSDLNTLAARRVALDAHGLTNPRPVGRIDRRHLRRVVDQIGLLQIDSVNVVCRSHYLPLFARLGPYDPELLHRLARDGELVEGWVHEATFLPAGDHRLFEWRRQDARDLRVRPQTVKWVTDHSDLIAQVLAQIGQRGALSGRDFEGKNAKRGPWWGWGDAKMALEWLFRTGAVGSIRTPQFERKYDLMDRILPAEISSLPEVSRDEAHRVLLCKAAAHLGVATSAELADYHRLQTTEARNHVRELADAGELAEVSVDGWSEPGFMTTGWTRKRRDSISTLISPFDPVTWHRNRAERLFDFRYRIEIYTPKPKRVYGYYVLPFVHRSGIRARVDVKHDRKHSTLRVFSAWGEAHDDDPSDTAVALGSELVTLAMFLGASDVDVSNKGDLAPELAKHVG